MIESSKVRVGGTVCLAGGLVGAAGTAYVASTAGTDGGGAFSYPHPIAGSTAIQMVVALVPAVLIVGLFALRWNGAVPATRRARFGYYSAIAIAAGLTSTAGIAVTVPQSPDDSPSALGVVYACYVALLGCCLVLAGLETARHGGWTGWDRWLPVVLGGWLVVVAFPALAAGFSAGGWAMAGWLALLAVLGLDLTRQDRQAPVHARQRPRVAASARAAAVLTWLYVAAFGSAAIPVAAYLLQTHTLPSFFDLFSMFGGPLWGRLSIGVFIAVLAAFFLVSMLAAWAAWMLWNGSKSGAILGLLLLPVEAVFWAAYALPIPPIIGIVRLALILLAWPSLSRQALLDNETVG